MKKINRYAGAVLLASAMFAGCASSPAQTSSASKTESQTSSVSAASQASSQVASSTSRVSAVNDNLVEQLVAASSEDAKAQELWMKIFQNTADFYKGNCETEGDGEIYEYTTDDNSSFVNSHLLYKDGRENGFMTSGNEILAADLIDLDNSFEQLISGAGVISKIGETSTSAVVKLTNTEDDHLNGTVEKVVENSFDRNTFAAENLREAVINCGFARTVDPVHDSSLYSYDLQPTDRGYTLRLSVKDLDSYKAKAASLTVLTSNVSGASTIGLNEITNETFVFDFNKQGILEQASNNIFHAIYTGSGQEYVNVRNVTEIDRLEDLDDFSRSIGGFMNQIENKSLSEGSAFNIEDWQ